jgi:SAM-dependent methyltransferase
MNGEKMLSYEELAWTEPILTWQSDDSDEVGCFVEALKAHSPLEVRSLLHLGCGAGRYDQYFSRHFSVTGVDISAGMLKMAALANPGVKYVQGDMRNVCLGGMFDAVVIPDSIDYMVTLEDLERAVAVACGHLRPGGLLLVACKTREDFRENNFVYTGEKDGISITVFENNHVPPENPSTYEATLVYLIRRGNELSIHTDRHKLGLFSLSEWLSVFDRHPLLVEHSLLTGIYEPYISGEGSYPIRLFSCTRLDG